MEMVLRIFGRQVDRDFVGGLYLAELGALPAVDRIERVEAAGELWVGLLSREVRVVVEVGQRVERGELLGEGGGYRVHSPAAGEVVGRREIWSWRLGRQEAIVVQNEKLKTENEKLQLRIKNGGAEGRSGALVGVEAARGRVIGAIRAAGVLGTGGAPLASLLERLGRGRVEVVVANAVGLEPTLNGPGALLRSHGPEVFAGLAILKTWLGASEAWMAYPVGFPVDLSPAAEWSVRCVEVSEKYPQGRPGAVLRTLSRRRVLRRGQRAAVFGLETLREVERAVLADEPVLERVVTVCGDGVERPGHFLAPVGLPLGVLLARAGMRPEAQYVVAGSSLAGTAVAWQEVAVDAGSWAFTVVGRLDRGRPQACVRCGWCLEDCPAGIDPSRLGTLAETGQWEAARAWHPELCVECGICSYVCPSQLRLMEHIRLLKRELGLRGLGREEQ